MSGCVTAEVGESAKQVSKPPSMPWQITSCGSVDYTQKFLKEQFNEESIGVGITYFGSDTPQVFELFVDKIDGMFTGVVHNPAGASCYLISGTSWTPK